MMEFQMYWPNWWKLWPSWSKIADMDTNQSYNNYESFINTFSFGLFQWRWYSLT